MQLNLEEVASVVAHRLVMIAGVVDAEEVPNGIAEAIAALKQVGTLAVVATTLAVRTVHHQRSGESLAGALHRVEIDSSCSSSSHRRCSNSNRYSSSRRSR